MKKYNHAMPLLGRSVLIIALAIGLFACTDKAPQNTDRINVMFIGQITDTANATPLPEAAAAVEASVKAINARGGIGGKALNLMICDDKADANEAAKCARKAARDGVVATLGNTSNFGNVILPILAQAGIASIGHNPISAADFSSPIAFPLQAGSPGMLAGAARMLAEAGAQRIRIATVDSPAGAMGKAFASAGLEGTGSQIVGMSMVPIGAPDYAIYAAAAVKDSDAVLISMNADQGARFIVALRQQNSTIAVAATMTTLTPQTIAQLGEAAEGIGLSLPFMPDSAETTSYQQFVADMERYAPEASRNSFALQAWLSAQALAAVMSAQEPLDLDAQQVLSRFNQLQAVSVGDVIPPLTTLVEKPKPFNRLFVDSVLYGQVSDGVITLRETAWQPVSLPLKIEAP